MTSLLAMLRMSQLLSHISRVCTTLTFSSAVASFSQPFCPSNSTLSLPLLTSAAHFLTVLYNGGSFPRVSMKFSRISSEDIPFLQKYNVLDNHSDFRFLHSAMCRTLSLQIALHKQPSMAACFSHSQCPSFRSNDLLTNILIK